MPLKPGALDRGSLQAALMRDLAITGKPGAACPEVIKRIPLITNKGGACISCRLCPEGKSDIRFSISKKER